MNVSKAWRCEWSMAGCWLVYLGNGQPAFSLPREMEREAKLLAAAPALLDALKTMLDAFVEEPLDANTDYAIELTWDAINKATANMITDDPADADDAADTLIAHEDLPLPTSVRLEDAA